MNFFASDPFLEALALAFHPGRPFDIDTVEVEGHPFRLLRIGRRRWVTRWPFLDFHEPLSNGATARESLRWLPAVALGETNRDGWVQVCDRPDHAVAPYVDWEAFDDFDAFLDHVRRQRKRQWTNVDKRLRKMERELGRVRVELDDRDPSLVVRCLAWKSRQKQLTSATNAYAHESTIRFFQDLANRGVLEVSSVRVGHEPVAIHLGVRWEGRFYAWIAAYDWSVHVYAPGLVLFHRMMEASYRAGDRAFDFLEGDEDFKWFYANRARLLGPLGSPELPNRVWRPVRRALGSAIRSQPEVHAALTAVWRRIEAHRPVHA